MDDPRTTYLSDYKRPIVDIVCHRCNRQVELKVTLARQRFGNPTMAELARIIALRGGCALADPTSKLCSAQVREPSVERWATLYEALHGRWRAILQCRRSSPK